MKVLVYFLGEFSKDEGVGNVALNIYERMGGKNIEKVILSPGKWRKFLFYSFISPLWFSLKAVSLKPDVVLAHTTESSFDPVVAKKIFRFKYKVVCVAHGLYADLMEEYLKEIELGNARRNLIFLANLRISVFRSLAIKFADKVVAVSRIVKKSIKKRYSIESIVIPNGIEKKIALTKHPKKKKVEKILFVGNQFWLKGLHYLITGNNLLKAPKKIIAIGISEQQEQRLRGLVDCNKVIFKRSVSREELFNFYKSADIFAMPSVYESFGIVYLEALAFGLPVIASKSTGAEDIAKHSKKVFLVQKRSPRAIAKAISSIESKIKKGLPIVPVEKKFFWGNISKKYEELILSVSSGL